MVYCTMESFPKGKFCNFCKLTSVDPINLGSIYQTGDIIVHYFCLLLASKGVQRGTDKQGLLGFLPKDIKKEIYRGSKIRCIYCRRTGATVICAKEKCKSNFHLPCGLKNSSLHFFCNDFKSLCVQHRPKVIIPAEVTKSIVENKADCIICFTPVDVKDIYSLIWSPCCKPSSLQHKKCVQEMAFAAGYYFKCPFCADEEKYKRSMQQFGIYVPEQEASWERDPHAFSDFNTYMKCAHKSCSSPRGPLYNRRGTRWQLENCTVCGSNAIHLACSGIWKPKAQYCLDWECSDCMQITKEISSKADNKETEIVSRFSLIGRVSSFLSSYTMYSTWRGFNEYQNKLLSDEQECKRLSLRRTSERKINVKNLVLFITDDLLMNGLCGLKDVKEIVVNNKRCVVLIKKSELDEYRRDKMINCELPTMKGGGAKVQNSVEDGKRLQKIQSTRNKQRIINTDEISNNTNEESRSVESLLSSTNAVSSHESICIQLNNNLKKILATSPEDSYHQTKICTTETDQNKNIWNYSKNTISNSLTIEYKEFFKQFKNISFLYSNKSLKLTIRSQAKRVRHYFFKPYLRITKTNSDISSNFSLWNYFYQTGVIKKRSRLEVLTFINKCPCIIFTDSTGLIYADLIKSFLPQNWPVKIIMDHNTNVSDLLIEASRVLMKASEKTTIILILSQYIWCDSSREILYLLEKITINNNYGNLVISQIPQKQGIGRSQCKQFAHYSNKLLYFSEILGFKVWDIKKIFL